jgi:hypothetical protein
MTMPDILTTITSSAVSFFRARSDAEHPLPTWSPEFLLSDPVLRAAQRASFLTPISEEANNELAALIFAESEFSEIAPREGELEPMLMHPGGGVRLPPGTLIASLFSAAFLKMYFLRLTNDEGTFVRNVLEGYEELRRAVRGERVRAYAVTGIAHMAIPEGIQISTPWGMIQSAPQSESPNGVFSIGHPTTRCILAESRLLPVRFDRAPSPDSSFDPDEIAPSRSRDLLPLACALASRENVKPVVPLMTWSTLLLPFQAMLGYSFPFLPPTIAPDVDFGDRRSDLEEWARVIERAHVPSLDIAARRLVSAVAHRLDRSDSLIDAVMVWENLLGTASEVTFRVSAALAKLLEPDASKRPALRKRLSDIYGIRSRLVHGSAVEPSTVEKACADAVDVAVRALRASYRRGGEWLALSSSERSDAILLEWS